MHHCTRVGIEATPKAPIEQEVEFVTERELPDPPKTGT